MFTIAFLLLTVADPAKPAVVAPVATPAACATASACGSSATGRTRVRGKIVHRFFGRFRGGC